MKKKKSPIPIIICILAALVIVGTGAILLSKGSSGKKKMDPETYFAIGANEAAVIIDGVKIENKGICQNEKIYLPFEVISTFSGNPFFYEDATGKLYLTLQDAGYVWTKENDPEVMVLDNDGQVYVEAELVKQYSDVEIDLFYDYSRAVVTANFKSVTKCSCLEDVKIRYEASKKSPIIYEALQGEELTVASVLDDLTAVYTDTGFFGYVKTEDIDIKDPVDIPHEGNKLTQYETVSMNETIKMVWHYVDCQENNDILDYMLEGTSGINVISPTWFALASPRGEITSLADQAYVQNAHNRNIKVWALVNDYSGTDTTTGEILADPDARAKLIDELINEVIRFGIDGLNIDFEGISIDEAPAYIQFLKELSKRTHSVGIFLSVDNYVPTYTAHYNRVMQSKVVDYAVIMGYDEHTGSSAEPGSVASLPFVINGIEETLKEVPANKTILGVPFYTRGWDTPTGAAYYETTAYSMASAKEYIDEHGISLYWDDAMGQNVGTVSNDSGTHSIWMEDAESLAKKLELVKKYNLAGAAAWRLGQETADVWQVWNSILAG